MLAAAVLAGLAAPAAVARKKHGPPRRTHRVYYRTYAPAPFVYSGVTYIPLRNATSLIGAALLWDGLRDQATITYNGREIGLVVGSPTVVYGGETVVLAAAPVVVGSVVYVPVEFCTSYLELPVEHSRGLIRIKGHSGWHELRVAARPPGRVIARERLERRATARKVARLRPAGRERLKVAKARNSAKPAKERSRRVVSEDRVRAKGGGHAGLRARGEGGEHKASSDAGGGHGGGKQRGRGKGKG